MTLSQAAILVPVPLAGQDGGVTDALFRISRVLTGAFLRCPPMREGHLDLCLAGL